MFGTKWWIKMNNIGMFRGCVGRSGVRPRSNGSYLSRYIGYLGVHMPCTFPMFYTQQSGSLFFGDVEGFRFCN